MHSIMKGYRESEYLTRASAFLAICRQQAPLGGMWDVPDLHWWWRDGGYEDTRQQLFLESFDGTTLGMVLKSERYLTFDYEIFPGLEDSQAGVQVFREGLDWLAGRSASERNSASGFFVRDEHEALRRLSEEAGFHDSGESYVQTTLALDGNGARDRGPGPYIIRPLTVDDLIDGAPPVLGTTAAQFARVRQSSLYRQDQHLVAVDRHGEPVAECIYWIDPLNSIGVIEPVKTRRDHRQRGVAKTLLGEGVRRMAEQGVGLAKVSHYRSNLPAAALYRSVGFQPRFERIRYVRPLRVADLQDDVSDPVR